MGVKSKPVETWVDDEGAHEIHQFANGWGLSIINEAHRSGVLAEPFGKTALLRAVLHGWEVRQEIAAHAVPEELDSFFIWDGTGSWEGRAEAAAILAAVESYCEDGRVTLAVTRSQLEAWTGRELDDEQVRRLSEAVAHSSVPDAIGEIAYGMFGSADNDNDDE